MSLLVRTLLLAVHSCRPRGRVWSATLVAGSLVLSGLITSAAAAEQTKRCAEYAARLDSLEGKVQWQIGGESQWQAASLNQTFCYGDIIRVDEKRAALRLSNNTLVRLNEHSSIKLIPPTQSFWVELINGAAHFLTRTPKSFTVKAPYVNAAVEGTEFLVSAHNGVNQVGVIEGVVRSGNTAGSVVLTQGMSTQTTSAEQAPGAPVQLKLNDFVSWAMYFPPLPNRLNVPADIKTLLEQGKDGEVIARINQDAQASAEMLSLGAALALNRGQIPAAEALVQRAFKLNPKHPDAQAIAALLDLGRGEAERGQQKAAQNVLDNPFNPTALIAHSYSQQSQGRLQGALDSALEAQRIAPGDSQIIARVAELHLALGQKTAARQALDKALALTPKHPRLLTFKGFSLLAERKGKAAQTYFANASSLDSADPYAQLGWGLALIQQGKLEPGREHLELAVVLDPANSLLRSYLGKGYFEENRLKVAETQLNLAKTLDANDPTPWYYLSQLKHDQHRYGEALQLVETAIEKNNNRAVYRQDAAMDSDAAARLADKSRIYQAMGADQLAISAASDAIRTAPNDYAGHRAMAMALTGKEGNQTARANEALQASLLAPIGATPLAPGFAETAMQVLPGAGPHEMGINEYNAAFSPNGINGFASVLGAGNNTRATEGQVQLVGEKTDISLGQYHYSSDGFKENNDRDYLVNEARLKNQLADNLITQITASERRDSLGDVSDSAAKEILLFNVRGAAKREAYSLGVAYSVFDELHLMMFKSYKRENISSHYENEFSPSFILRNDDKPLIKSDVLEFVGRFQTFAGDFYAGYGSGNVETLENYSSEFVIGGFSEGEPDLITGLSRETVDRYFFDYVLNADGFYGLVGVEQKKIKDYYGFSDENFYRADIGFKCLILFECGLAHDEFLSLPSQIRDDLRLQISDVFYGRSDYLPFAKIKADSISVAGGFEGWKIHALFQVANIKHPLDYDSAFNPILAPEFQATDGLVEFFASAGVFDAVKFQIGYNSVEALYGNGANVRANIPHEANTDFIGFSVRGNVYGLLDLAVDLKSIDQRYIYPLQLDLTDFPTRARFVNLNFSAGYRIASNANLDISILNALGNRKEYVDGSPVNLSSDSVARVDSFVAERVVALSAKLSF